MAQVFTVLGDGCQGSKGPCDRHYRNAGGRLQLWRCEEKKEKKAYLLGWVCSHRYTETGEGYRKRMYARAEHCEGVAKAYKQIRTRQHTPRRPEEAKLTW